MSSVNTAVSANSTPVTEVQCDDGVSPTSASVTNNAANSDGEWQAVVHQQRKEKPKPTVRVCGAKVDAGTVTAVPRKPVLTAFVGRLHLDTTEEELTEYLKQEGMKGVVCKWLKPKKDLKFNTAAFYMSSSSSSSTTVGSMPVGV